MHEKPLKFGHIHENITYFCIFEMRKKNFEFFGFLNILEKNQVFLILSLYLTV